MKEQRAIVIDGMSFSYGEAPVLENVNMTIDVHEFVAIIGPNGGGKTTLIKLMMGLLNPTQGSIRVFGNAPWSVRRRFGYVPQHPHLDYGFPVTAMDVVLMGRLGHGPALGPHRAVDHGMSKQALEVVSCSDLGRRPFSALSSGQRQRVLIARALTSEPDILVLDEPTANLDPSIQDDLYDLLHKLNERMAVIIVSHDVGFVSRHVSKIVCVNREAVLHEASDIKGDVITTLYGGMDVRLVDHDHHSHE